MNKMTLEVELAEVEITVDQSHNVKVSPPRILVHKGDIAFQVVTPGWRFASDGVKFNPTSVDGRPTPNGLFTQVSRADRRIVFHDRYDDSNYVPADYGEFGYQVSVEETGGTPHPEIEKSDDNEAFNTGGVVVNQ
jgi:hypothetical protein